MARRKRSPEPVVEHTFLSIRVERYDARVEAGVNLDAHAPQYAYNLDEDDPLYQFGTQVTITGTVTYPDQRAGERYEITIDADNRRSRDVELELKDVHQRDKNGHLRYRSYRGRDIPVFKPPPGITVAYKTRGEPRWTVWLPVQPTTVSDAMVLLGSARELYVALHERKEQRKHWVQSLSVQTTDPAEE